MKKNILSIAAFLFSMLSAYADNISVPDMNIIPGETATVGISLVNTATKLVSFQMDLTLPEGITINKAGCSLSSRFTDEDQELTIGKQGDNVYRLTSTSFALTPISGTSGEIITLSLSASATSTGGTATLSNIRFVTSQSERIMFYNVSFNIAVGTPSPVITFADANVKAICVANWDTNGDGELSEDEAAAVTSLGEVFKGNTEITSFNELQYFTSLTEIPRQAFMSCSNLTSAVIPNNITQIGYSAFDDCYALASINLPSTITNIDGAAFSDCRSLTSITLPEGIPSIGEWFFNNCVGLREVVIPESVTTIGHNAFYGCTGLNSIRIPDGVSSIGYGAFSNCPNVTSIVVAEGNTTYDSRNNCNAIIETATNKLIKGCNNTVIPSDVTSIGNAAFYYCTQLTSIVIPEGVTSIESSAFDGCTSLTLVTALMQTPVTISSDVFSNRVNAMLTVPYGSKEAYEAADYWNEFKEIVEIAPQNTELQKQTRSLEILANDNYTAFPVEELDMSAIHELLGTESPVVYCIGRDGEKTKEYNLMPHPGFWCDGEGRIISHDDDACRIGYAFVTDHLEVYQKPGWVQDLGGDYVLYMYLVNEENGNYVTVETSVRIIPVSIANPNVVFTSAVSANVMLENVETTSNYPVHQLATLDMAAIKEAVGTETPVIYAMGGSGNITKRYTLTPNPGFWFNSECKVCGFGNNPVIGYSFVDDHLEIYQHPGSTNVGDTYTLDIYFVNEETKACAKHSTTITIVPRVAVGDTFPAPVPCDEATTNLTFKVTNVSPLEVEVMSSPEDIAGSVTIPATVQDETGIMFNVKGVGGNAFEGRTGLTSIDIPSGVWVIGEFSFRNCTSLETVILPNSVSYIGYLSFGGCSSLTSIVMPETIVSIDGEAFNGCTSLTSIQIPNGLKTVRVGTFKNCTSLTSINLPDGITTIEESAFRDSGLESIKFPSTLTEIGENAFHTCSSLKTIDFNDASIRLNAQVFWGCTSLEEVYIPKNVKHTGWNLFWGCTSLKTVVFEAKEDNNGWEPIYIFNGCTALESVVVPFTSMMGGGWFSGCSSLKTVTFLSGVPDNYRDYARNFQGVPDDVLFTIPEGTAENYLKRGYKNLSDKSGLPLVREEFEAEAVLIGTMSDALTDGDKATLTNAISEARATVNATDDYMTVYAQIAAIKTAAKTFLKTATLPDDFDVTAATVTNSDFGRFSIGWNVDHIGDIIGYKNPNEADHYHENGDVAMDYYVEAWRPNSALTDGNISQIITTLPAGIYRFEADVIATNQNDANAEVTGVSLFANSSKTAVATENNKPQHFSVEFTQYEDADCTIGVNVASTNANWVAMDNVRLYRLGGEVPAAVVDAEETYYLQNVETGLFLNQGNSWGTHAVLKDDGLPLRITRLADGSYTFCFLQGSNNGNLLFRDDATHVYVDYSSSRENRCPYWTITATDVEGVYHIQSLITDSRYGQQVYPGTYLGNNPAKEAVNHDGTHLGVYNDVDGDITDTEGMNLKWRFVTQDRIDALSIVKDLEKLIDYARAAGTDVSAAEAVANNVNASSEEVTAAIGELRTAYLSKLNEGVSEEFLPLDVSGLIVNADFDHNDSHGWTNSEEEGIGEKSVRAGEQAYEFWNTAFDFHQTLSGLPNGNYLLKMKGFHRTENYEGTTQKSQYGEPTAVLYANGENQVLRSILDGMTEGNLGDDWPVDDEGTTYYVPKNMAGVAARFARDMYWNEVPVTVTDGELTIGVKLDNYTNSCWVMFDEFRLILLQQDYTNKLYAENNSSILPGGKTTLGLKLKNDDEIIMTDFFLLLPDGFSIADNASGKPDVTLNGNRSNGHVVTAQQNEDGYYHVVCYSSKNNALIGNDGVLFNIKLLCNEDVAAGKYAVEVKNILMTDVGRNSITQPDFSFGIEVPDMQLGDVNDDSSINGLDIVELVDHIMQRPSDNFNFLAADLNFDEKINGLDLVKLVSLVLSQGITPASSQQARAAFGTCAKPVGNLRMEKEDDGRLTIGVDATESFILAQCIIELSDGMLMENISSDGKHSASWQQLDENRYAVVTYSSKNDAFTNNDALLTFAIKGEGNININDILLVDEQRAPFFLANTRIDVTSGISGVYTKGNMSVYDLSGRKYEEVHLKNRGLTKGVYIVNGKKMHVK